VLLDKIRQEARGNDLVGALRDCERGIRCYESRNKEVAWRFRVQKAHILVVSGSHVEALQLLSESPPSSLDHSDVAVRRKMVQGIAHDYLQKYDEAGRELSEAAQLAESYRPDLLGDVLQARGNLEIARKNYSAATPAFQKALQLDRNQGHVYQEATVLGSLGYLAMWQEHYDEAIEWFKAGLQKSRTLDSEYAIAKIVGNLGWNYSAVGDFDSAEVNLKEAEDKAVKANLLGDQVKWNNMLSLVYFQQRRYDLARVKAEAALALAREVKDNRDITDCLNTSSDIALVTGHVDEAEKYNREALGVEAAGSDQFNVAASTIIAGRIAAGKKQFQDAEKALQKVIGDKGVETPLRWEAQADLAEVYAGMGNSVLAEREFGDSIGTISKAWRDIRSEEFQLSFLSSAIRFYGAYVNFLIGQKRPLDALKVADRSRAQTLEHGLSLSRNGAENGAENATAKDALKRAPTSGKAQRLEQSAAFNPQGTAKKWNATLLFYWLGEQRSHLWVITPTKVSLLPLPVRSEIDARVKSYLDAFPEPKDPLEIGNADGKRLYKVLIEPAEKLIPKNSRVIILPDGDLSSLNFETLIVPGGKPRYWIEDVTVSTGNSLALLAKASPAVPPADASLFLMGDAVQASPDFPPLPQAGKEAGLVEKYFPAAHSSVFTGAQATPSAYLSGKPEDFSFLHFSTHGTASTLRPLESAVILSPEGDAYKLYARDILQHPLHAYLVTISACNGAGMKTYAGEGLVGLAWAFLRAGAHNVIGGLWEVSNASTPQLMDELYKGLNEGKDPASALRNAKLTLVHSTGNYRRPYYWGPFQLYAGS